MSTKCVLPKILMMLSCFVFVFWISIIIVTTALINYNQYFWNSMRCLYIEHMELLNLCYFRFVDELWCKSYFMIRGIYLECLNWFIKYIVTNTDFKHTLLLINKNGCRYLFWIGQCLLVLFVHIYGIYCQCDTQTFPQFFSNEIRIKS